MAKPRGTAREWAVQCGWLAVLLLLSAMVIGGLALIVWAVFGGSPTTPEPDLAYRGYVNSLVLTGITTVYCGITGFILLENRRMRIQAVQPHVQLVWHGYSDAGIAIDLENSGAGPAVDIKISAWILNRAGAGHTPEPDLFRAARHSLPAVNSAVRILLGKDPKAENFKDWVDKYKRVEVPALNPKILLLQVTYKAVGGARTSNCIAVPLQEQPKVPVT